MTSKYIGVSFIDSKKVNRWRASMTVNNKYKHLGYFAKEIDAYFTYREALSKLTNDQEKGSA